MQPEDPEAERERPDSEEPVEVPWKSLSPEALRGVVEAFVLREGTDYGAREFSHEEKVAQVIEGLETGEVRIVFDPVSESVTLLLRE
ncbi:MAG: YheU family protein [Steroidobacteraceae bacterium]